jgi:hypothetical protein
MEQPKFCKDCKHYCESWGGFFGQYMPESCSHPSNISAPDLIHGRSHPMASPADMRNDLGACKREAVLFEAKPPEPAPAPKSVPGSVAIIRHPESPRGFWASLFGR